MDFPVSDYFAQGFLTLQNRLDQVIFEAQTGKLKKDDVFKVNLRRMPYPPYNDDNFVLVLQNQFPFILLLSFIFSALHIVKDVVYEKETKLKVSTFTDLFLFYNSIIPRHV